MKTVLSKAMLRELVKAQIALMSSKPRMKPKGYGKLGGKTRAASTYAHENPPSKPTITKNPGAFSNPHWPVNPLIQPMAAAKRVKEAVSKWKKR